MQSHDIQPHNLGAWIALQRSPGISSGTLRKLLHYSDDPAQAWQLGPAAFEHLGINNPRACQTLLAGPSQRVLAQVQEDLRTIEQQQITVLTLRSPEYPALLKETIDPPPLLYIKGQCQALNSPQIAMVGSRRCSIQGGQNAYSFARRLATAGITITSGGALGIDTHSHLGALEAGQGCSIAVLGTGVDVVYPKRNQRLFADLVERGALVSEFPLGTQAHRALFPQRNRLISGLSLGVLVVEAALQSGSLITARFALEQGREVFAIPSSIHNPAAEGCHQLIQQGAKLTLGPDDIMEELAGWLVFTPDKKTDIENPIEKVSANKQDDLDSQEITLLNALGYDPIDFEDLLCQLNWPVAKLQGVLTTLEIKGLLEQSAGCYQRLEKLSID